MSLFGGSDLSTVPGVRLTATSNSNGDLRKTGDATTVPVLNKNSINPANGKPKLDPSDPRVQKLVYSMYRNMLTAYNEEANDFVSQKDPDKVKQDLGVGPILQTIIIRQGSQQGSSTPASSIESSDNSTTTPSTVSAAPIATGGMPPPPPPPLIPSGAIPAVRLNSEIGPRDKGPPMALANAMMKDKKPFTYTPGGIDLSEIRSPRMAKRIQMNAAAEGVTSAPENRPAPAPPPGGPPGYLPPAALAAMQPQMAIPVFPQGGFNPANLNKTHKPSDFVPPPPPGPPPFMQQLQQNFSNQNRQQSPPPPRTPPPPPVRSSTPTTVPVQFELRPVSNSRATDNGFNDTVDNRVSPDPPVGVGTGCIYIPPVETQKSKPTSPTPAPAQKTIQTKAQAHSQNLGSIYIPPIEQKANERSPGTAGSSSSAESPSVRAVASPPQSLPPTPMTPLLNKAPTPWMNSYNRMQPPSTPPYVNPANIITPWGTVGAVRNIPISMADEDNNNANSANIGGVRSVSGPSSNNTRVIPIQIQRNDMQPQQQQPVARNIPIQMEGGNRRPPAKVNQTPSTPGTPQPGPGYQKRIVPAPYNNPMGLYSNQNAAEAYHKQAGEIYGMDSMSIDDANRRTEPIQSKSLRVIQKVAEDVDEGSSLHQSEEPRFRGGHIPSRAFRALQSNLPSPGVYEQAPNYQTQAQNAKGQLTHNIQILMQSQPQSPIPQQQQAYQHHIQMQPDSFGAAGSQSKVPPSQQKVPEPKKYMGSNIPSRSFKILQAMTADDDSTASESEAAPEDQNSYSSDENSETNPYPFPYPYAFSNDQDPNSEQGQGHEYAQQGWPENFEGDPNWDPYTYMSWYYWWYYTSCYWNGYDMTGFEYPANWDPNYFPEGYSSDYSGYETCPEAYNQTQMDNVPIPSKSFKNLQKSYENEDIPTGPDVPKIVIESETSSSLQRETETENTYLMKPDSSNNVKLNDCDTEKNVVNQNKDLEEDSSSDDDNEDDYESCVEEQMVIKSETGSECNRGTENNQKDIDENEDDEEDEETEPEDDDGDEGIVEEPETPSSEDSDAATLVDEVCYDRYSRGGSLTIEEYQSPSSDSCDSFFDLGKKNRLSTIDELTENERSRTSSVMPSHELEFDREPLKEEFEDEEEDDDSDSDSDDLSSVSVIENKSDAQGETTTATESKREDGTTSSEDGDGDVEDDGDENDIAAVTVRLPLKLSFTKSKSYRDIATVLVCDSEVCSGEEASEEGRTGQIMEVKETTHEFNDVDGHEPAVSFTISLSRSTSKNKDEDVVKNVEKTDTVEVKEVDVVEESVDIDFWSQIGSSEVEKSQDFWETKKTPDEKSNDFSTSNPATVDEPIQDFWGALSKEKSKLAESVKDIDFWGNCDQTDDAPPPEQEESKTEEVLDFWGEITGSKSEEFVKTRPPHGGNETKKSVSWDRKDSINYKWDNEFNFWDKSVKSVETRRFSHNFEISEAYESDSGLKTENRRKKVDRLHHKRHSIHGSIWDTLKNKEQGEIKKETETDKWQNEEKNAEEQSPWSYWDNLDKEKNQIGNHNAKNNNSDSSSEDEDENHEGGNHNTSAEIRLPQNDSESESESEDEEPEEMKNVADEMKKCIDATTKSISAVEYPNVSNTSVCHSEAEAVPFTSSRLSPALPISDENSDESSSKSSATTIGRDKSDSEKGDVTEKVESTTIPNGNHMKVTGDNASDVIQKGGPTGKEAEQSRRQIERPVEIRELREKIKLSPSKDLEGHQEESCTCHLADRMARAEGLLWRIERFLQESLSLGSEDDSGVMTDLSRQISDVDTDADNDINDNEFLLTAAFAAKQKRSGSRNNVNNSATNTNTHQPNCTHSQTETQPKKRPTSEILLESHSKTETEVETDSVKMRSASERKALRYQRAKTHSRLFQLLQVECSKEDEDDDFDGDSAPENAGSENNIPIETEQAMSKETAAPSTSTEERRSRLVPLPIKNFLTSSLSCDSNSSPSGSSGVLSPTSPVNRDQLLADIINEFHLRHQQQNQKRLSNFPSKIFKLLQQEFGEEFYQTFDCCTDDSGFQIPVSVEGDKHCQSGSLVQECTIHKSESLKLLEEAAALRSSGSPSLNSKDKSANHSRKSNATAKNKNTTSSNHRTTATAIATESTEILTVTSGTAATKDSKFLEVPLRRKKSNVNRDPRSPRTKKS